MIHRRLDSLLIFVDRKSHPDADYFMGKVTQKKMDAILEDIDSQKRPKPEYTIAVKDASKVNKNLNVVVAAGGMVLEEKDKVLLIYRDGSWDLPKGKAEKGEKLKTTAKREIQEETGVKDLEIIRKLEPTYHWYKRGKWLLKESMWYEMKTYRQKTTPQKEEGLTKAEWISKTKLPKKMKNMYPNIRYMLTKYYLKERN